MITKTCHTHGPLTSDLVKTVYDKRSDAYYTKCKLCVRQIQSRYKRNHPEKHRQHNKNFRERDPEAYHALVTSYKRASREELHNWYLRQLLVYSSNYDPTLITPELIEYKRASIMLKRKILAKS